MSSTQISVGIDDFEKIREDKYYYVDKTWFIKELLDKKAEVNLFTRPRRCGNTLNLSMLKCFFEIPVDGKSKKALFDGLKIMEAGEEYRKKQESYPVIFLTLKSAKQKNFELAHGCLKEAIGKEYLRHDYVLESLRTKEQQRKYIAIRDEKAAEKDYQTSLAFLSECLYQYHQKKVIILIDEYDVPLENAYFQGFYDDMMFFIRSVFESVLKSNPYLEFSVITGCLRISKESIFTGLNNLEMLSILNRGYAEYFGFTRTEIKEMLHAYGLEKLEGLVKEWYDGYLFGSTEVYNPWSIVCFVKEAFYENECAPKSYWATTSSNTVIRSMIDRASDAATRNDLEILMQGGEIEKPVHEDVTYDEIYNTTDNLWNFMFFTGYLKKSGERIEEDGERFISLKIPNKEVALIFRQKISGWFQEFVENRKMTTFYQAIVEKDTDVMQEELSDLLMKTISYEDYRENFYHGFLLGCLTGMKDYIVLSNREGGLGRSDIIIKHPSFKNGAYILELKYTKNPRELEEQAELALKQIKDKKYREELYNEGYDRITCYGISFCKKDCCVKR
ncbi:MAG: AAA family ATPase [Lachnospiraceae bacterium]|nr:AAA family ATPase [Lachnospiraceae bacterium]